MGIGVYCGKHDTLWYPGGSRVEEWGCETLPLMVANADDKSLTVFYTSSNRIRRHRQAAQSGVRHNDKQKVVRSTL